MIDGMFFVVVNSDGMVGFGELFVYVINVQILEVNVVVVGDRFFSVKVLFYLEILGVLEVSEFKQIIFGIYQRVLVMVFFDLINGDQVDVFNLINIMFVFVNVQ